MQTHDQSNIPECLRPFLTELPPLVARREVKDRTGGVVNENTLKNDDNLRRGPRQRVYVNGRVAYPREAFVEYLVTKIESVVTVSG